MKRIAPLAAILLTFGLVAGARSAEPPPEDPATSAFGYCITCHGVNGRGNPGVDAPRIGGMEAWYIEAQLHAFRKEWRGKHPDDVIGVDMQAMALAITEEQVGEVAAWFEALETPPAPDTVAGDPIRGQALYATCATCHGAAGEGNRDLAAPALAGQSDWYLVTQLNNYRQGIRGYLADDTLGAQMRAMAGTLVDEQAVADVVAYIKSID